MIYRIYYDNKKRKFATRVKNREELILLRNAQQNLDYLDRVRKGDQTAKPHLLQLAYNMGHVEGALAGCKSIGSYFFHDVDCYDEEHSKQTKELILEKKDEIGLKMLERSVSGGWHLVCQRIPGTTILENQVRVATALQLEMDTNAKDLQRVVFSTSGSEEDLPFLDDSLFDEPMTEEECIKEYNRLKARVLRREENLPAGAKKSDKHYRPWESMSPKSGDDRGMNKASSDPLPPSLGGIGKQFPQDYHGIPFTDIIKKYWEVNNRGFEPTQGDRDTLTYQLACDLRHICGKNADWLDQVIPCYDGFAPEEKRKKIESALSSDYEAFPTRLRNTLAALSMSPKIGDDRGLNGEIDDDCSNPQPPNLRGLKILPQGVRDSIEAAEPGMEMTVVAAICPCIGALASGVQLDVHKKKAGLNLISYIVGDFASGKGLIDPIQSAWMAEVKAMDDLYLQQEEDWRNKKLAAKNKKEQPEEPKLPVRCIPLNNTVANIAERLANVVGKHAFSFTPEADVVAQKWKSSVSDFSVMIRQAYDGSRYDREARSVEAVNVHIDHLLWNVVMCGTPDALYRVISNYTDGLQSRIAFTQTPDNTFAQLADDPRVLTDRQAERIRQIAHLLPLMQGEVVLPKLEETGRKWLEKIRLEAMLNDDRVKARQRIRICVTTQRMVCCLMLCKVCEQLIQKHGMSGAEKQLQTHPNLWKEMLLKTQTPQMLELYDLIADSLLENALYFFRNRIEKAYTSRTYGDSGICGRVRRSKNDTIYESLDMQFTFEQALKHSIEKKGSEVTSNSVQQMLKNWRKQKLIELESDGKFKKLAFAVAA
jgi:hypothetical protein